MIDEKQILAILRGHILPTSDPDGDFHAIYTGEFPVVVDKILSLFKNRIHFTPKEIEDLQWLTAGSDLEWCQKLNRKFGGAG